jgi:hypothetical protein
MRLFAQSFKPALNLIFGIKIGNFQLPCRRKRGGMMKFARIGKCFAVRNAGKRLRSPLQMRVPVRKATPPREGKWFHILEIKKRQKGTPPLQMREAHLPPPVASGDLKKNAFPKGKASPAESGRGNASQSLLLATETVAPTVTCCGRTKGVPLRDYLRASEALPRRDFADCEASLFSFLLTLS